MLEIQTIVQNFLQVADVVIIGKRKSNINNGHK